MLGLQLSVLFLTLSFSVSVLAQEEICTPEGVSDNAAEEIIGATAPVLEKINLDRAYCEAIKSCGNLYKTPKVKLTKDLDCKFKVKPACGLTKLETHSILFYTYEGYSCLNRALREGKTGKEKVFGEVLKSALDKLPNYRGFVSRMAKLPPEVRKNYEEGKTVTEMAFTSTSTRSAAGDDIFTIYSLTGKPIMDLSQFPAENEVLFKPSTKFRVLKVNTINAYRVLQQYLLREVGPSETEAEAVLEDQRVLSLVKSHAANQTPDRRETSFQWNCPKSGKNPLEVSDPENFPVHHDSFLRKLD